MTSRLPLAKLTVLAGASVVACAVIAPVSSAVAAVGAAAGRPSSATMLPAHSVPALHGGVSGIVRSITGAGLPGICVTAAGTAAGRPQVASAVSGQGGRYLIRGLLPGRYRIGYQACGKHRAAWAASMVAVRGGHSAALRPVTLRPVTSAGLIAASRALARRANGTDAAQKPVISGIVTNSKGQRLSGICVSATSESQDESIGVGITASRHGTYSFGSNEITPGRWTVEFTSGCGNKGNFAPQWWQFTGAGTKAKVLVVGKHSHFTGIDAKLVTGASLSGTLRAGSKSGPGLRGVCVLVTGLGPVGDVLSETITGQGGKYRVADLGTGRYQILFDPECGAKGNFAPSFFPKDVAVKDGKTTAGVNWFVPVGGEISGTVTTGAGHAPVAGICVNADSTTSVLGFGSAKTAADGSYVIQGLVAGKYSVSFSAGCGNKGSFPTAYYDNQVSQPAAAVFAVAAGQDVAGIDENLPAGGTVTGTVRDSAGHPLAGICVAVASTADEASPDSLEAAFGIDLGIAAFGSSGKDGTYAVGDLLPGDYTVSFAPGCGRGNPPDGTTWFAPQGGTGPAVLSVGAGITSGIDAKLPAAGTIAGVVRGTGGKPLGGVCAVAVGVSGQPPSDLIGNPPVETGKTGKYRITDLGPGKYQVAFETCGGPMDAVSWYKQAGSQASATTIKVRAGHATAGIDQTMIVGTSISGRVTNASTRKPVARWCALAIDPRGNEVGLAFSAANGDYSIGHLAPASYSIEVLPCQGSAGGLATEVNGQVRLRRSQSLKGVNFALPRAGSVAGEVTGGSPATPLAGACVMAETPKGVVFGPAFAGANGKYVLGGLAPGQYFVNFSSLCGGSTGGFVDPEVGLPVTVTSAATASGVDATLDADGGIAGTVTVSGSPAAGVCVIARPFGAGMPFVAVTGSNGGYQLNGVTPAGYQVEFTAGCGVAKYTTQWFDGAASRGAATPVTVSAGTVSTGIDAH